MKTSKHNLIAFAISLFTLVACSEQISDPKSGAPLDEENMVVVQNHIGGNLRALNGQDGSVKWTIPDYTFGGVAVGSRTLFVNRQDMSLINHLMDTVNLYGNKAPENLLSLNGASGKITGKINNMLRPPFLKKALDAGDPTTEQWNELIKIEDGGTFMQLLQINHPSPTVNTLYATDLKTGLIKWKFVYPNPDNDKKKVIVQEGRVFCGSYNQTYLLDAFTGKIIQQYPLGGDCAFANDHLFVASMDNSGAGGVPKLVSLHAKSGAIKWEVSMDKIGGGVFVGAPLIDGDLVYISTSDGIISAFDINNGERKWMFETVGSSVFTPYRLSIQAGVLVASPTDASIYVPVSGDRKVYALNLLTGEKQWDVLISHLANKAVSQPIKTRENLVYAITNSGLAGIDSKTGQPLWHRESPKGEIIGSFSVFNKKQLDF